MKFRQHQHGIGKVFFTADTHFGHAGVIRMCKRDFPDVQAMDQGMIAAWNAVIGPRDVVFHVGDFAHDCTAEHMRRVFHKLNGQKHLIRGNHDRKHVQDLPWISQHDMLHVTVDGQRMHLCHYGLRTWPGIWKGAIHLYGHSHGRLPGNTRSMDIGVDAVGYLPLELEHIKAKLALMPEMVFPEELDEGEEFDIPTP
jgi:calcineurin-like phosphoesterase family protein